MIATSELEAAIRSAIPILHLEIIDQSNGCGENYAVLVVSEVSFLLFGRYRYGFSDHFFFLGRPRRSRARRP